MARGTALTQGIVSELDPFFIRGHRRGIVKKSAPSGNPGDSRWPADINDWKHWSDPVDLQYLATRINGLKAETLEAIILSHTFYSVSDSIIAITPEETLGQLIHDPEEDVRYAIPRQPGRTVDRLRITDHEDGSIPPNSAAKAETSETVSIIPIRLRWPRAIKPTIPTVDNSSCQPA